MKKSVLNHTLALLVLILACSRNSSIIDNPGDTLTPTTPENLRGYGASSSTVKLFWDDKSTDETAFVIRRQNPNADTFVVSGEVGPNVMTFEDQGLTANTFYTYVVSAQNDAGESALSTVKSLKTLDTDITLIAHNSNIGSNNLIRVSGNYAFLSGGDSTLHVIDVSQRRFPVLSQNYFTNMAIGQLILDGDYAYISSPFHSGYGIKILNKSNPYGLSQASAIQGYWFNHAAIRNGRAYFVSMGDGLYTYDVTNPASPSNIGSYWTADNNMFNLIALNGMYAYLGCDNDTIQIMNIFDPVNDSLVNRKPGQGIPKDFYLLGNNLFVANNSLGLVVYDISNPVEWGASVGFYYIQGGAKRVMAVGHNVYVLDNASRLRIISAENMALLTQVGFYDSEVGWGNNDFYADSSYVYIADNNGLTIIRYTPPGQ